MVVHTLPPDDEFVNVTHFRRPEGDKCKKTHDLARPLLQRQFLEAVVRVSLARFPHERGLESQLNRLFKELLKMDGGGSERSHRSDGPFACIAEPNTRKTLEYFEPTLSQIFGSHAQFTQTRPGSSCSDVAAGGASTSSAPADDPAESSVGLASMRGFGDFPSVCQRSNVRARLDVTVRVKDALKLLDSMGLICPTSSGLLGEAGNDFGCALPQHVEAAILSDSTGSFATILPPHRASTSFPDVSGGTNIGTPANRAAAGMLTGGSMSVEGRRSSADAVASSPDGPKTASSVQPDPSLGASSEDFSQQDVRCNLVDALRIITGVLSSASLANIKMQLDPNDMAPNVDAATLLEYLETELIYSEFERMLMCLADRSLPFEIRERMVPAKVLEGYLQFVFLPALSSPYVPPQQSEAAKASPAAAAVEPSSESAAARNDDAAAAVDAATAGEEATFTGGTASAAVEEQPVETSEETPAETYLHLWYGFEGTSPGALAERNQAPRAWPTGFEMEVATW
jgi:hypothetical protein